VSSSGAPRRWADELVPQGYVVAIPDSFEPRGFLWGVCTEPPARSRVANGYVRAADAYGTLAYLRTLPYVDGKRIAVMGGSHGGWTTLATLSEPSPPDSPLIAAKRDGFAAGVALYPSCVAPYGTWSTARAGGAGRGPPVSHSGVYQPLAPLLILIGEKDDWTPAEPCRWLTETGARQGYPVRAQGLSRRAPLVRRLLPAALRAGPQQPQRARRPRRHHRRRPRCLGRCPPADRGVPRPPPENPTVTDMTVIATRRATLQDRILARFGPALLASPGVLVLGAVLRGTSRVLDEAAQPGDVALERRVRTVGRIGPERVDQAIGRDHPLRCATSMARRRRGLGPTGSGWSPSTIATDPRTRNSTAAGLPAVACSALVQPFTRRTHPRCAGWMQQSTDSATGKERNMPLVEVKLIEGVFSQDQQQEMITRLTETMIRHRGRGVCVRSHGCLSPSSPAATGASAARA